MKKCYINRAEHYCVPNTIGSGLSHCFGDIAGLLNVDSRPSFVVVFRIQSSLRDGVPRIKAVSEVNGFLLIGRHRIYLGARAILKILLFHSMFK